MRITRRLLNAVTHLIDSYSNYNPSPLSLKKFADFGKLTLRYSEKNEFTKDLETKSYIFLKEELLVRLSLMTKEMLYLPDRLIQTSSVKAVHGW